MKHKTIDTVILSLSVAAYVILAATFLFMPLRIEGLEERIHSIIMGTTFYSSLVIGIGLQVLLARRRITWIRRHRLQHIRQLQNARIGVAVFANNIFGCIADATAAIGLIVLIISMVVTKGDGYVCYVALSVFVLAFCLHCIFNGKIFYYVLHQEKILSAIQKEKSLKEKENESWSMENIL